MYYTYKQFYSVSRKFGSRDFALAVYLMLVGSGAHNVQN